MRRKVPTLALPSLPKRLASKKTESRAQTLFRFLQKVGIANRKAQPQTFYSLREVAHNFSLPISMVRNVFVLLEEEGIIGRVRGSRTVLHGRKFDRHLYVRGVVGLPVSIFQFCAFADYRTFITQIRRQLRSRGFMPAAIFFERDEIKGNLIAQYLFEAKADSVIWFSPDRQARETLALLGDAGVRVTGVSDYVLPSMRCRYEIRRENALRSLVRAWLALGLTSTVVVSEARRRSAVDEERCLAASVDEKLPSEIMIIGESALKRAVGALSRRQNRGIFLTASAAAFCAARAPRVLWDLMQKRRVALVDGPVGLFFGDIPAAPVDIITVDWGALTSRIVDDLISQAAWEKKESLVFHAEAHLRVPLNRICHEI